MCNLCKSNCEEYLTKGLLEIMDHPVLGREQSCVSSSLYSKYLSQTCLSILTNFDTAKLSPGVAAIINYNNGKCLYMFDYVCFILNSTYINVYIAYDIYRGATW